MITAVKLCILALALFLAGASAAQTSPAPSTPAEAIIAKLNAHGTGKGIKITETNGHEIKGTLVSMDAEGFSVIAKNATAPVHIAYTDVAKVGSSGMSAMGKVGTGLIIGVVACAVFIVLIVALAARG